MLDRTFVPSLKPITLPKFIKPVKPIQDRELFLLRAGTQEVVRVEVIFPAGTAADTNPTLAGMCNRMLREGTKNYSAKELADKLDFYGAYLESETDADRATVSLYTMTKYLPEVLPLFHELLTEPIFPEKELEIIKSRFKQQYLENQQKVSYLSKVKFTEELFKGENYGCPVRLESYDELHVDKLRAFYEKHYSPEGAFILVTGNISSQNEKEISRFFSSWSSEKQVKNKTLYASSARGVIHVAKEDALQSAIRMGRTLPVKPGDEDYDSISIYNTILGGYFGSRLMNNIREDKGYTYGIGSGVVTMDEAAMFVISTEVKGDATEATRTEINKELTLLCTELVGEYELETVKNYRLGGFLRGTQGPFEQAERFKSIYFRGLDYNHYEQLFNRVNSITSEEIQSIAQKYFTPDMLFTVWAGK